MMKYKDSEAIAKQISIDIRRLKELNSGINYNSNRDEAAIVGKRIEELLLEIQNYSLQDNFYFFDCPMEVYLGSFNSRFDDFKSRNVDSEKSDFIESEIRILYSPEVNRAFLGVNYHSYAKDIEGFKFSLKKKKVFLKEELRKLGRYMSNGPAENVSPYEELDLDDEIRFSEIEEDEVERKKDMLSRNQVVLLLDSLGVFSELERKGFSQIDQARLVNRMTGFSVDNIKKSMIALNNKKSSNGKGYQKDIDLINRLLKLSV